MRKFNKKTKKPKKKSVKKPRKQKKRKVDDRFVTKRKSKSPASWQNLGLDSPNTNARRSSINLARFTPLRAQVLLKRHGFGATMHMLNPNKCPSPPHSERRRLHFFLKKI